MAFEFEKIAFYGNLFLEKNVSMKYHTCDKEQNTIKGIMIPSSKFRFWDRQNVKNPIFLMGKYCIFDQWNLFLLLLWTLNSVDRHLKYLDHYLSNVFEFKARIMNF